MIKVHEKRESKEDIINSMKCSTKKHRINKHEVQECKECEQKASNVFRVITSSCNTTELRFQLYFSEA